MYRCFTPAVLECEKLGSYAWQPRCAVHMVATEDAFALEEGEQVQGWVPVWRRAVVEPLSLSAGLFH